MITFAESEECQMFSDCPREVQMDIQYKYVFLVGVHHVPGFELYGKRHTSDPRLPIIKIIM